MHVWMNLNFIAYIDNQSLVEFPLYIQPCKASNMMQCMKGKCFKHKARSMKPNSLKPSRLLPHWHPLPKWEKKLEGQYSERSSKMCAFLIIWVESTARIHWRILGGNQTILRIKRLQNDNKVRKHQRMKQAIIGSNEPIGKDKIPSERNVLW